eukprot:25459-Chlamydomonas_euryale.AAC.2
MQQAMCRVTSDRKHFRKLCRRRGMAGGRSRQFKARICEQSPGSRPTRRSNIWHLTSQESPGGRARNTDTTYQRLRTPDNTHNSK